MGGVRRLFDGRRQKKEEEYILPPLKVVLGQEK